MSKDVIIKSIDQKLHYTVNHITDDEISYSAPTRNNGEPEIILYADFAAVISRLQEQSEFNTSSAKKLFTGTRIYKKRSPFFAILLAAGIIEI